MSGQKRRFLERTLHASTPTFIAADSVIRGDVRGVGGFIVSGEVHGDGDLGGDLILSVTGRWHGTIRAQQALIAGRIVGGLEVEGKLEIGSTAVIHGRVSARTVAIAVGAVVDGEIEVTETPILRFEERRNEGSGA